jgi:hypothetical protein
VLELGESRRISVIVIVQSSRDNALISNFEHPSSFMAYL